MDEQKRELIEPQRILDQAIEQWQPVALVALFSGGYDSAITTHVLHRLDTHGLPIQVWAIDTQLAADGWREYVQCVADELKWWNFFIYDNIKGFSQYIEQVRHHGCPYSRSGHTHAYRRLKERGIDAIHMMCKLKRADKTLFVSGVRHAESADREKSPEVHRVKGTNNIFAAPIIHWTNEMCDRYRVEYGLPDNPFYDTVRGSGDCQCNWGDFITLGTLQQHSPNLANGNVKLLDELSKELHGFGWHSKDNPNQMELIAEYDDEAELTSPFLCQNCSRAKVRASSRLVEARMLQADLF